MNKVSLAAITVQSQDYATGDYTLSPVVYVTLLHYAQFFIDNTWLMTDGTSDAIDELIAQVFEELSE